MADFDALEMPSQSPTFGDVQPNLALDMLVAFQTSTRNEVAPTLSNLSPSPGSIVRTQAIAFDIADPQGFARIVVWVVHASGLREVVHDGDTFLGAYIASSTKTSITDGFHFSIVRTSGGWPVGFDLKMSAIDAHGNERSPTTVGSYTVSNADTAGPTITNFSPAKTTEIAANGSASFDAYDASGDTPDLGTGVEVYSIDSSGVRQAVYLSGAFQTGFSGTRDGTNNRHFAISRTAGWQEPVVLEIYAVDAAGNVSRDEYVLHLTGETDATAPTVSNVSPAPGSSLSRTEPVFLDVTDAVGLRRVILSAEFEDGAEEVVHDGDGFAPRYAGLSTRTPITNGFQYRVQRAGGWPYAPTITAYAIDTHGNEV